MNIAVIGTVFVDIKGYAAGSYVARGRNVGRVDIVHGGVARNVAEDLSKLGAAVRFVSCADDGGLGSAVTQRLRELGVDTRFMSRGGMGVWMVINDERGEQAGSLSQLPDVTPLIEMLTERGDEITRGCDCVVLEPDISLELAKSAVKLCKKAEIRLFVLPGNMSVILQYPEVLRQAECFICNEIEAGRLFSRDTSAASPEDMLEILGECQDAAGARQMVVTMGEQGAVWRQRGGECGRVNALVTPVCDVTGAGDAFFSGTVFALLRGHELGQAVRCGTQLAAWTVSTDGNCFELTEERKALLARMESEI